jgi:hypothetical protein
VSRASFGKHLFHALGRVRAGAPDEDPSLNMRVVTLLKRTLMPTESSAYEVLRRTRAIAPTPELISARLVSRVSGSTSEGPPLLGSALTVAVALAEVEALGKVEKAMDEYLPPVLRQSCVAEIMGRAALHPLRTASTTSRTEPITS